LVGFNILEEFVINSAEISEVVGIKIGGQEPQRKLINQSLCVSSLQIMIKVNIVHLVSEPVRNTRTISVEDSADREDENTSDQGTSSKVEPPTSLYVINVVGMLDLFGSYSFIHIVLGVGLRQEVLFKARNEFQFLLTRWNWGDFIFVRHVFLFFFDSN